MEECLSAVPIPTAHDQFANSLIRPVCHSNTLYMSQSIAACNLFHFVFAAPRFSHGLTRVQGIFSKHWPGNLLRIPMAKTDFGELYAPIWALLPVPMA
eukprot:6492301-Amphidinium_carterae.10